MCRNNYTTTQSAFKHQHRVVITIINIIYVYFVHPILCCAVFVCCVVCRRDAAIADAHEFRCVNYVHHAHTHTLRHYPVCTWLNGPQCGSTSSQNAHLYLISVDPARTHTHTLGERSLTQLQLTFFFHSFFIPFRECNWIIKYALRGRFCTRILHEPNNGRNQQKRSQLNHHIMPHTARPHTHMDGARTPPEQFVTGLAIQKWNRNFQMRISYSWATQWQPTIIFSFVAIIMCKAEVDDFSAVIYTTHPTKKKKCHHCVLRLFTKQRNCLCMWVRETVSVCCKFNALGVRLFAGLISFFYLTKFLFIQRFSFFTHIYTTYLLFIHLIRI